MTSSDAESQSAQSALVLYKSYTVPVMFPAAHSVSNIIKAVQPRSACPDIKESLCSVYSRRSGGRSGPQSHEPHSCSLCSNLLPFY